MDCNAGLAGVTTDIAGRISILEISKMPQRFNFLTDDNLDL